MATPTVLIRWSSSSLRLRVHTDVLRCMHSITER